MNAPVKPIDFTDMESETRWLVTLREHQIAEPLNFVEMNREQELELLEKLRAEAVMPEWHPER